MSNSTADVESREPNLGFVIPPTSENRWSDLLASFIATDPTPMAQLLGCQVDSVRREVLVRGGARRKGAATRADRLDLLLSHRSVETAAIEAKLLAPLGADQLDRYAASWPTAGHWVLHLGRFPMVGAELRGWRSVTWEAVLDAYAASRNPWVALTARTWRRQVDGVVPVVGPETRWNDVPADVGGFEVALRARLAWLHQEVGLHEWEVGHDLVVAANGGSWVLRLWLTPPLGPLGNLYVTAEVSEGMPSPAWRRDPSRDFADRLEGPRFLVGLRVEGVVSSADFPWETLRRMFHGTVFTTQEGELGSATPVLVDTSRAWSTRQAQPRHPIDRANHADVQSRGAPAWLGQGYGMAMAKQGGACIFGARFALRPDVTTGHVLAELGRVVDLLTSMRERAP